MTDVHHAVCGLDSSSTNVCCTRNVSVSTDPVLRLVVSLTSTVYFCTGLCCHLLLLFFNCGRVLGFIFRTGIKYNNNYYYLLLILQCVCYYSVATTTSDAENAA